MIIKSNKMHSSNALYIQRKQLYATITSASKISTLLDSEAEGLSSYRQSKFGIMKAIISFGLLCLVFVTVQGNVSPPKVQVYSHFPGEYGKENTLICHVSDFHPPDIKIELLKNGEVVPNAKQTDLAFEKGWRFHLTQSVTFTPQKGEDYTCRVRHMENLNLYRWEPNM